MRAPGHARAQAAPTAQCSGGRPGRLDHGPAAAAGAEVPLGAPPPWNPKTAARFKRAAPRTRQGARNAKRPPGRANSPPAPGWGWAPEARTGSEQNPLRAWKAPVIPTTIINLRGPSRAQPAPRPSSAPSSTQRGLAPMPCPRAAIASAPRARAGRACPHEEGINAVLVSVDAPAPPRRPRGVWWRALRRAARSAGRGRRRARGRALRR
ncbi:MAG: hypothetical protein J3K34DRAFT_103830 [Monoraphidium minutum]|nr:MAG: hypothetical protein J3K34DRAFT_103830 [Monoraphidium minutum]